MEDTSTKAWSDLEEVTSPSSGDEMLLCGSSDARRIDYTKLAKAIIEEYTGSTLAGSAQSIKSAFSTLNSKFK